MKTIENIIHEAFRLRDNTKLIKIIPKTKRELKNLIKERFEKQGSALDFTDIDVRNVEDMGSLFDEIAPTSLNLSNWKVSNLKNARYMFYNCENLTKLDLSRWDVSNVSSMRAMFFNCNNLKTLNLSGWKTDNCEFFNEMFAYCTKLERIDGIEDFKVDKADTMKSMFNGCENLPDINFDKWNVKPHVNTKLMFNQCNNMKNLPEWYIQ